MMNIQYPISNNDFPIMKDYKEKTGDFL